MAKVKGGNKFRENLLGLARTAKNSPVVKVGFLENATYPSGLSVPLVAAFNEFGVPSRGQPPRPFFRSMISKNKDSWAPAITNLLKANKYDEELTANQVGEAIAGQLRQSIKDLVSPPLAPSTIAKKGFDKPLIDTSVMINSIGYEVVK